MLRNLQIWHVLWLALTPILFALFRLSSEPHDADRALIDNLFVLGAAGWLACVTIYFVVTGKTENAMPSLLRLYRGLLNKVWFLWIANIAGTALVGIIVYHLVFFRQVEFLSTTEVELILNDRAGEVVLIGFVQARIPSSYRLPIGSRKLVFREIGSDKILDQMTLPVPSVIQDPRKVRTIINYQKGTDYERTR